MWIAFTYRSNICTVPCVLIGSVVIGGIAYNERANKQASERACEIEWDWMSDWASELVMDVRKYLVGEWDWE